MNVPRLNRIVDLPSSSQSLARWTRFGSGTHVSSRRGVHALVTGATGFIGRALVSRLLAEGKRVRCFVRNETAAEGLRRLGAEAVIGSLDDREALQRAANNVELVVHLAALTSAIDPRRIMRVNGRGSRNVARACAAAKNPPRLVYVSSIAAAGPAERDRVRVETDEPRPVSWYGRSKLAGEKATAESASEVPVTIVRPGIVFGPHNRELLPVFRTIRRMNVHPVVGFESPPLSYIHVEDCVDLILKAAEKGTTLPPSDRSFAEQITAGAGVYFATVPEYPNYAELGRLVRPLLNRPRAAIVHLPRTMPWLAAGMNQMLARVRGVNDSFNLDKIREASAPSWACSGALAREHLGFAPARPLQARLSETVEWYLEQRWL